VEHIAIFAALRWECRPVLRHLRRVRREAIGGFTVWRGTTPRGHVWLVKTGIGPMRAEAAAGAVTTAQRFDLCISTGCAGGLAAELLPGDLTVATAIVCDSSGQRFHADAAQVERLCRTAQRAALRVSTGPVLCSGRVLTTAAAKQAAAEAGSLAVEMEGRAIAARAAQLGIPFVSVRAILDSAAMELPHAGRFVEPQTGALKPLALAGHLARHPGVLTELFAMQRLMHAAQRSLEQFFAAWLAER
jgi:adenosylhomocysteine nucleosidase